jgi:hypothetical protein
MERAKRRGARGRARIALAVALAASAAPAAGDERASQGTFSLVFENDAWYGDDGDYTSGLAFVWAPNPANPPAWSTRLARGVPWWRESRTLRPTYALGQSIFTPKDTSRAQPLPGDRPYAGWLYATIALGLAAERWLDQVSLTLGVVGPASLAEQVQEFGHRVRGSDVPKGWDSQLGNEPGFVLTYQRSWRPYAARTPAGLELDLATRLGAAVGNVYTYANAGMTARLGSQLPPDYGPLRITPDLPSAGYVPPARETAWYVFAGADGRAVARNIFLDGNTFQDSPSVDKESFVGDFQGGIVVTWRGARLSYTHATRTREYKTQRSNDDFGSVTLSVPF